MTGISINPFPFEWVLRALIDFTLSNARRFYSSMGNLLDGKGLRRKNYLTTLPPSFLVQYILGLNCRIPGPFICIIITSIVFWLVLQRMPPRRNNGAVYSAIAPILDYPNLYLLSKRQNYLSLQFYPNQFSINRMKKTLLWIFTQYTWSSPTETSN